MNAIEICCGTGRNTKEILSRWFKEIDLHDGSKAMLKSTDVLKN